MFLFASAPHNSDYETNPTEARVRVPHRRETPADTASRKGSTAQHHQCSSERQSSVFEALAISRMQRAQIEIERRSRGHKQA
jgi:hypothetical protein